MPTYRITSDNNIIRVSRRDVTVKIVNNGRGIQGIPGSEANLLNATNIIPALDNTYTLGTPEKRWGHLYVGPDSISIIDTDTDTQATLSLSGGALLIDGSDLLRIGNMSFTNTGIKSEISSQDITIGAIGDTGYLSTARGIKFPDDSVQDTAYVPSSGDVTSVNSQQGDVVLDTDDIADTAINRYTNDSDIARLANTSGVNTGDQNLTPYTLGAASSTDNALTRFDGTTGKIIQNSTVTLSDAGTFGNVNAVQLDTTPTGLTPTAGQLSYNATDGIVDMGTGFPGVTIQVGMENVVRVRNNTGATITNGQVVYVSGALGNRPTVALADADAPVQALAVIGVATADIANNADGLVTTGGIVRDLNTSSYDEGTILYLSGTPGAMTDIAPVSPQLQVFIGTVTRAHGTQGEMLVRPQYLVQKDDLGIVTIAKQTIVISTNTAAGTTANTDYYYSCTAALTFTLPTGNTNSYTVKNRSAGNVTIAGTIDGDIGGALLYPGESMTFIYNGTDWDAN